MYSKGEMRFPIRDVHKAKAVQGMGKRRQAHLFIKRMFVNLLFVSKLSRYLEEILTNTLFLQIFLQIDSRK